MGEKLELYAVLGEHVRKDKALAVATIIRTWGSTPREVGAKMLVDRSGEIYGTVGGGCGEAEVWQAAQSSLLDKRRRAVHVDLIDDEFSDSGKVCGGRFEAYVDLWSGNDVEIIDFIEARSAEGKGVAIATVLGPASQFDYREREVDFGRGDFDSSALMGISGAKLAVDQEGLWVGGTGIPELDSILVDLALNRLKEGESRFEEIIVDETRYGVFVEVVPVTPRLVVAGAGHIARPLVILATVCGFAVTVVDDREQYADRRYFPWARKVVCSDFREFFAELKVGSDTYIVLVTRGHRHDQDCLRFLAGRQAAYIGMIGSRRRVRAVKKALVAEGIEPEWLDSIYAPIGIDIGARTPEEIALCIVAEMVNVRRQGNAISLRHQIFCEQK